MNVLKSLVEKRHLTYELFVDEYKKAAKTLGTGFMTSFPSRSQYFRWINGQMQTAPQAKSRQVLEAMFPGYTVDALFAEHESAAPLAPSRRQALQAAGSALVGAGVLDALWSDPMELHRIMDTGTVSPRRLDRMERLSARLAIDVVHEPPGVLLPRVLTEFRGVKELLADRQPFSVHGRLVRLAGQFATIVGEILFDLDAPDMARSWYGVAQHAGEELGDRHLVDFALAGETMIPSYDEDPREVLDLVGARMEGARAASPALAWLWGFRARALAMQGDERGFAEAIEECERVLGEVPAEQIQHGIFSFRPEKVHLYKALGALDLGDHATAAEAAQTAVSLYDPSETTEPALARLTHATAMVGMGELGEGCRLATETVLDPRTYQLATVLRRAHVFDRLLPPSHCEEAREWKETLAGMRPPSVPMLELEPGEE